MFCAVSMYAKKIPYVVQYSTNAIVNPYTLLFAYAEEGTYQLNTNGITNIWTGDDVINAESSETVPEWKNTNPNIRKVIFDPSFAEVRPTSTAYWFSGFGNLTEIVGMKEYLNTSEVTNMSYMFNECKSLTSIDVSGFNTSNVKDMSHMFQNSGLNSLDLSNFNTSKVENMSHMFQNSSLKSLNLSNFNTSKVENMCMMFKDCTNIMSLDLSSFDTSNVTDMSYMFANNILLSSLNLSSFDTSNVTNMECMFFGIFFLPSLDLSSFNTSSVTNMCKMFSGSNISELDLSNFNTSNVKTMQEMFSSSSLLKKLDLSSFNTSNVTNMKNMFNYCTSLTTLNLTTFNTSSVNDMEGMFMDCSALTTIYCYDSWNNNTSIVNSTNMFLGCTSLVGASGFGYDENCLNVAYANPSGYFTILNPHVIWCAENSTLYFLADGKTYAAGDKYKGRPISRIWDDRMGFGTGIITATGMKTPDWNVCCNDATTVIFEESFDYVRPTSTWEWFMNFRNLTTITGLENLNTSATQSMYCMFLSCEKMTSFDISTLDMSSTDDMVGMFGYCNELETVNLGSLDMSGISTVTMMFAECPKLTTIYCDNAWNFTDENSWEMFLGCTSLVGASGVAYDANNITATYANPTTGYFTWTKSNVLCCDNDTTFCLAATDSYKVGDQIGGKTISSVWGLCDAAGTATPIWQEALKSTVTNAVIDESFANERPKYAVAWFENFTNLTQITGLSNFNTSEVTDMRYMFSECKNLEALDLSTFNTAKVKNMAKMFRHCEKLASLNLSTWDTSNLTDMNYMFQSCRKLSTPDLSNFNTAAVKNMSGAFVDCQAFTVLDLRNFNTSNVTNMRRMFDGCKAISLDLRGFDVSKVNDMYQMFRNCTALKSIFCDGTWSCASGNEMFLNCTSLVGGNGTTCDGSNNIDVTYARPDDTGSPGYFTPNPLKGDLNYDGLISVTDITILVNIILGIEENIGNTECDINEDGFCSVSDISSLVNLVLGME